MYVCLVEEYSVSFCDINAKTFPHISHSPSFFFIHRYYVAPAFTLATTITSRRAVYYNNASDNNTIPERALEVSASGGGVTGSGVTTTTTMMMIEESGGPSSPALEKKVSQEKSFMYYINDGVYGSFNCLLFDHAQAFPKVLGVKSRPVRHKDSAWLGDWYDCSVWGPTCDSMDCISKTARLPELHIGDWLYFEEMGAYTLAAASRFNGFDLSRVYYTNTEGMP